MNSSFHFRFSTVSVIDTSSDTDGISAVDLGGQNVTATIPVGSEQATRRPC
jgi:hypothetical protein